MYVASDSDGWVAGWLGECVWSVCVCVCACVRVSVCGGGVEGAVDNNEGRFDVWVTDVVRHQVRVGG